MNKLIILFFSFNSIFLMASKTKVYSDVKVEKCIDGDTCWFKTSDDKFKVRFSGVDAPEKKQEFASTTSRYVFDSLKNSKVDLKCTGQSFDRKVCEIFVNGTDFAIDLISKGYAFEASSFTKNKYSSFVASAKSQKLGVWGIKGMQSPFCFRQAKRKKVNSECIKDPMYN